MKPSPHFKRQESYQDACVALDNAYEDRGWKQLATHMGFERNDILQWIDDRCKEKELYSPSSILLDFYLKDATEEDILDKMQRLSNYLLKMHNEAAKRCVDEEIRTRLRDQHVQSLKASLVQEPQVKLEDTSNKKRRASVSNSRIVRAASIAMSKTRDFFSMTGQLVSARRTSYHDRHLPDEQCAWGVSTDANNAQFSGEIRGIQNPAFTESTENISQRQTDDEKTIQADVHSASNTLRNSNSYFDQENTTLRSTNERSADEPNERKTSISADSDQPFTAPESKDNINQGQKDDGTLAQTDAHSASNTFTMFTNSQSSSDQDDVTAINTNDLSVDETNKRKPSAMSTDSGVGPSRPSSVVK